MSVLKSIGSVDQAKVLRGPSVALAAPRITSKAVRLAIEDVETLASRSPGNAVDRVHTMLHGYLRAALEDAGISYEKDASTTSLLKLLHKSHPKLRDLGPRREAVERVLNACGTILDAMHPVRNLNSLAHPNNELLGAPEAKLVLNVSRTILSYLDAKLE